MKTKLLFIALFLIAKSNAQIIGSYSAYQYIGERREELILNFIQFGDKGEYELEVDGSQQETTIIIKDTERKKLCQSLEKFVQWSRIADSAGLESEKEIASIKCTYFFKYGSGNNFDFNNKVSINFFSRMDDGKISSRMIINSPRLRSSSNQYIESKLISLYLTIDDAKALLSLLSDASINEYYSKKGEADKKKSAADDILK